jgi:hypothetical protein
MTRRPFLEATAWKEWNSPSSVSVLSGRDGWPWRPRKCHVTTATAQETKRGPAAAFSW